MFWGCCASDTTLEDAGMVASVQVLQQGLDSEHGADGQQEDEENDEIAGPMEYKLYITKPDEETGLGMVFDWADGVTLNVCALQEGDTVVAATNAEQPEDCQLRIHDFVVEVNGIKDHAGKMAEEVTTAKELALVVRRPVEWQVRIVKDGSSVGLDLHYAKEGQSLVVAGLKSPGRVEEWNADPANAGKEVRQSDRIIEVNGFRGKSLELFEKIARAEELDLVMLAAAPAH